MNSQRFDSLDGYRQALQQVLMQAERQLDWLDTDLSDSIAHLPATAERIKQLLQGSPLARLRLLLQDEKLLWRRCPQLAQLTQSLGHRFEVRQLAEQDRPLDCQYLLGENWVARRFHADSPRGELSDARRELVGCRQQFELMWQRAEPTLEGRRFHI